MTRIQVKIDNLVNRSAPAQAPVASPTTVQLRGQVGVITLLAARPGQSQAETVRQAKTWRPDGSKADAHPRQALRDLVGQMVSHSGRVASGYLRRSADGQSLELSSRWQGGDRQGAVDDVRLLLHSAYGQELTLRGMQTELDQAIDTYLAQSGGKWGSKSLVHLVQQLEGKLHGQALQGQARTAGARLQLGAALSPALGQDPSEPLKELRASLALQARLRPEVHAAELAHLQNQYMVSTALQDYTQDKVLLKAEQTPLEEVLDEALLHQAKVMERMALEQGLTATDFYRLMQKQGPHTLVPDLPHEMSDARSRHMHRDLRQAFETSVTLDGFYDSLKGCVLADLQRHAQRYGWPLPPGPKCLQEALEPAVLRNVAQAALFKLYDMAWTDQRHGFFKPELLSYDPKDNLLEIQPQGPQACEADLLASAQGRNPYRMPSRVPAPPGHIEKSQDLFGLGMSVLHSALRSAGQDQAMAELAKWTAQCATDPDAVQALHRLLGPLAEDSGLAFGRDCALAALEWSASMSDHLAGDMDASDHPYQVLHQHPFL